MARIHFLNVNKRVDASFDFRFLRDPGPGSDEGQCTIIQHDSGRVTVIDIFNGARPCRLGTRPYLRLGNGRWPSVNPLDYLNAFGIRSIHRFVLTHPHLDHMGGIKAIFDSHEPKYFWHLPVDAPAPAFGHLSAYGRADWDFYQALRYGKTKSKAVLMVIGGSNSQITEEEEVDLLREDGLSFLIPDSEGQTTIDSRHDLNSLSPAILFLAGGRKVLFGGDLPGYLWGSLLSKYSDEISNLDILVAPHHGQFPDFPREVFAIGSSDMLCVLGNWCRSYLTIKYLQDIDRDYVVSNAVSAWLFDTALPESRLSGVQYDRKEARFRYHPQFPSCPMPSGEKAFQL